VRDRTFVSQSPLGPMDHLVAARRSVGSRRSVRHVSRRYLPLLVLALVFAHDHHPYRPLTLVANLSVLSQRGPTPRGAPASRPSRFASL